MLRAPITSPEIAGFVEQLDPINAIADTSPGFVWRLQTESGNATSVRAFDDDSILINMSVWRSLEELRDYVYRSAHVDVLRRRAEWFERLKETHLVRGGPPADRLPYTRGGRLADRARAAPGPDGGGVHVPHAIRPAGRRPPPTTGRRCGVLLERLSEAVGQAPLVTFSDPTPPRTSISTRLAAVAKLGDL